MQKFIWKLEGNLHAMLALLKLHLGGEEGLLTRLKLFEMISFAVHSNS